MTKHITSVTRVYEKMTQDNPFSYIPGNSNNSFGTVSKKLTLKVCSNTIH